MYLCVGGWMAVVLFSWGEFDLSSNAAKRKNETLLFIWLKVFPLIFHVFFLFFFQSFLLPISHASLFLGWVILPTHKLFLRKLPTVHLSVKSNTGDRNRRNGRAPAPCSGLGSGTATGPGPASGPSARPVPCLVRHVNGWFPVWSLTDHEL